MLLVGGSVALLMVAKSPGAVMLNPPIELPDPPRSREEQVLANREAANHGSMSLLDTAEGVDHAANA